MQLNLYRKVMYLYGHLSIKDINQKLPDHTICALKPTKLHENIIVNWENIAQKVY
jgi:hypothetical protein